MLWSLCVKKGLNSVFDMFFLDNQMPQINGFEITECIRINIKITKKRVELTRAPPVFFLQRDLDEKLKNFILNLTEAVQVRLYTFRRERGDKNGNS